MKTIMFLLAVTITTLALQSCSDKDEKPKPANYFSYNGTSYPLDMALVESSDEEVYVAEEETYYSTNRLICYSKGIEVDIDDQGIRELSGKGHLATLEIVTTDFGNYIVKPANVQAHPNDIIESGFYMNYDIETETGAVVENAETGVLTFLKEGDDYIIDFTGKKDGVPIELHYKGKLKIVSEQE